MGGTYLYFTIGDKVKIYSMKNIILEQDFTWSQVVEHVNKTTKHLQNHGKSRRMLI